VLNIGSGDGGLEVMLHRKGVVVLVLDPSDDTVTRLRQSLDLGDRARQGHSQTIPFESGSVDVVIMTEVLEHLAESALSDTLGEVCRVLAPGGRFLGTVPYAEDLDRGNVFCPHCQQVFHQRGHLQSFTCARLETLLETQGLRVRTCHARAFAHWRARTVKGLVRAVVRHILGRLKEPIVSPNIYFESIKPVS
jgi:SAM-dependent methyltransferase